jgi:hypothetical protein
METTDFEDVLRDACEEIGTDPQNISSPDFMALRRFASKRLEAAWRYHYWPDLGRVEQRFYRLPYDATKTYSAAVAGVDNSANEVYWALTGQYFVALTTVPLATPPTDGNGVVDLAHWGITSQFAIQPDPTGTEFNQQTVNVLPFNLTVTYNQGDRVQYTNNVYQLFASTATGVLPTVAAAWGLVPPFDAYVPYEQTGQTAFTIVEGVFSSNPRITTRGNGLNYFLSERGVQVLTPIAFAWIQFRIRSPKLNGRPFNGEATYAAGNQMYYSSSTTPGNFYTCLTATAAGETPDTTAAKWSVVQIPRMFHRYLVLGIAADWERDLNPAEDAQQRASAAAFALAQQELDELKSLYVGQMGQRVKTEVRTR